MPEPCRECARLQHEVDFKTLLNERTLAAARLELSELKKELAAVELQNAALIETVAELKGKE